VAASQVCSPSARLQQRSHTYTTISYSQLSEHPLLLSHS
jgi:hypothetical protein